MPRFPEKVSASETLFTVLAEAKRKGLPWQSAWYLAMEALKPPVNSPRAMKEALAEERHLLQETKPWWQAAYEGRDVTVQEFEQASARTERRWDQALAA